MKPWGLQWRSSTLFIVTTVGIGMFTDLFLYGIIVPILPFMLQRRVHLPHDQIQSHTSWLLAAYAGASVAFSPVAGIVADRLIRSRSVPFLAALFALTVSTLLLLVGQTYVELFIARLLQGVSAAFVWTVGLVLVLDTVGPSKLGTTTGTMFGIISVGELASPVLGGVVYEKAGFRGVFGMALAILVVDFAMRLLLIEKKNAKRYEGEYANKDDETDDDLDSDTSPLPSDSAEDSDDNDTAMNGNRQAHETDALLAGKTCDSTHTGTTDNDSTSYAIPPDQPHIIRLFPLLYTLNNPRLLTAMFLSLVQAVLLGAFDATIPTVAADYYGITSLEVGIIFVALIVPYVVGGPLAGWLVDRYGPKPAAVAGYGFLVPILCLLRLVQPGGRREIAVYCTLLVFIGAGMAMIGAPSLVEASTVLQRYEEANPGFFGANGPYAQLYGLQSSVFSLGLTLGPLVSGALTDDIGYGNMNAVLAGLSFISSALSLAFIGGPPSCFRRKAKATPST